MSCKSALYAANTAAQVLTAGSVINFGSIVRRYGRSLNLSGGNAIIRESGYYDIDTNVSFTTGAAGKVTIQLYKDGVAIPGAVQIIDVAANVEYNFSIPAIVRNTCNCESTITATVAGVNGTVNNAAIAVERI